MYYKKQNGKMTREGQLWFDLKKRTNPTKSFQTKHPSYVGCKMSPEFEDFQYFAEWCNNQIGFVSKDNNGRYFVLDKDILSTGNKIYSEDNCVFVPFCLNLFFTDRRKQQGNCLPGVCWHTRDLTYNAQCNNGQGKIIHLGCFSDEVTAHLTYKRYKEKLAKSLAAKWSSVVDKRVVEALERFVVSGGNI